jgi:hypothetical protein
MYQPKALPIAVLMRSMTSITKSMVDPPTDPALQDREA